MPPLTLLIALLVLTGSFVASDARAAARCHGGLLPDLRTVVPKHLAIQNVGQREILRFTNGIANTGLGHWRLRPEPEPGTAPFTDAVQELLDADGVPVCEWTAGTFEYHPTHNHWHIADVAQFELRRGRDDGTRGQMGALVKNDRGVAQSAKVSFCLIDWYRLEGNSPRTARTYWDCEAGYQGIAPGWVDQYHQSTDGQQLDLTGAPQGIYYLVSTVNPEGVFLEATRRNNTAWVSFWLRRDSQGNPKIEEIANSPCDSPGLCGEQATNR